MSRAYLSPLRLTLLSRPAIFSAQFPSPILTSSLRPNLPSSNGSHGFLQVPEADAEWL